MGINSAARVYFNTTPVRSNCTGPPCWWAYCKNPALQSAPPAGYHLAAAQRGAEADGEERLDRAHQYDSLLLPARPALPTHRSLEGPAPYFREVLRSQVQSLLSSKDPKTGKLRFAKANGDPYDIYTDGLRIYTTTTSVCSAAQNGPCAST